MKYANEFLNKEIKEVNVGIKHFVVEFKLDKHRKLLGKARKLKQFQNEASLIFQIFNTILTQIQKNSKSGLVFDWNIIKEESFSLELNVQESIMTLYHQKEFIE